MPGFIGRILSGNIFGITAFIHFIKKYTFFSSHLLVINTLCYNSSCQLGATQSQVGTWNLEELPSLDCFVATSVGLFLKCELM